MNSTARARALILAGIALLASACASAAPSTPSTDAAPTGAPAATPAKPTPRPAAYQSDDFIVTFAQAGDTAESLAERYLGGADKAWMVEDYTGLRRLAGRAGGRRRRGGGAGPQQQGDATQ